MAYYDPVFYGQTIALYVSLSAFSVFAVILRFVARIKTKTAIKADDWWACISVILFLAHLAACIWGLLHGGGLNLLTLPPLVLKESLKAVYVALLLAISTITAAKFTAIFLYRRLFWSDKGFRITSNVVGTMCLLWWIGCIFPAMFMCTPVRKTWDPLFPGTCIDSQVYFLGGEIPNCILDFVIVILPVGVIRKLKLSLPQKLTLCFIFAIGGFVGVISMIRMKLTYRPHSPIYDQNSSGMWLTIQLAFAVICCCLPTYRPLLPNGTTMKARIIGLFSSIGSLVSRVQIYPTSSSKDVGNQDTRYSKRPYNRYNGLKDHRGVADSILIHAVGQENHCIEEYISGRDYPMDGIKVTKTVDLV